MIDPARFVDRLSSLGVELFTGVPDSLLKALNTRIARALPPDQHVIAANEGASVGLAIGHYLRTGGPAAVYLQNSGFGNLVNPLLSLADPDVYGVPMLLLVGWRGRPGTHDEPQHVKQGRVMTALLDALELPWTILPEEDEPAEACVAQALETARTRSCPYVLLVGRGTFDDAGVAAPPATGPGGERAAGREEMLTALVDALGGATINVATTGMLGRELFELRARRGEEGARDFLTVGGMGHATSIALGVAMREDAREVWCLDGDGALLMHLGTAAVIADRGPANLHHVVFNNGVHDSVGGQPTSIGVVDVAAAARALGYHWAQSTRDPAAVAGHVAEMRRRGGPCLLELRVRPGSRPDVGRPTRTPAASKQAFMAALGRDGP